MYWHSKENHQFENSPAPHTTYVVCATPRCGSSVLCEALCNTGLAGAPTEFFDNALMERFRKKWGVETHQQYVEQLLDKKTSTNGVFGTKAHFVQYRNNFGLEKLPEAFPNLSYIWVRRRDTIAQAVSYARANQSNQWTYHATAASDQAPEYSFEQIQQLLARLEKENSGWLQFFDEHQIEPRVLEYEDFANSGSTSNRSLLETVVQCLDYIGVELPHEVSIEPITLIKQADELSHQWCERFREETEAA